MFLDIISVALGGGLGAVCRYLCGLLPVPKFLGLPVATLAINFLGAFVIGLLSAFVDHELWKNLNMGDRAMLFAKVGFYGGFTTFSTFSLEMFSLMDSGRHGIAFLYGILSVVLCLGGVFLGRYLIKAVYCK